MKGVVHIEIVDGKMSCRWENLTPEQVIVTLETMKLKCLEAMSGPRVHPDVAPDGMASNSPAVAARTSLLARTVA